MIGPVQRFFISTLNVKENDMLLLASII
jgi:hypothetical protein